MKPAYGGNGYYPRGGKKDDWLKSGGWGRTEHLSKGKKGEERSDHTGAFRVLKGGGGRP